MISMTGYDMCAIIQENGQGRCFQNECHCPLTDRKQRTMETPTTHYLVRHAGRWIRIRPRPYEPERMTTDIAWIQIKEGVSPQEAYIQWFKQQRQISHLLSQ